MAEQKEHAGTTPGSAVPVLGFRAQECAAAIGISPRLLHKLTKERVIPHVRLGRAIIYPVRELQDWLSAQAAKEVRP